MSATDLEPGQTFTAAVELFNPEVFTVTAGNASLRAVEAPIVELFELVSCTGSISVCHDFFTTFRGPVGDVGPGESRVVVFTFRVRDGVAPGAYTLEHQFVGANYAFAGGPGPVVTVTAPVADLAVSLDASPRGLLTSRVTYTVTVVNNGPAAATGVRVGGTYAAGFSWAGGTGCVRDGGRNVRCDVAAIPAGGSVTASFSVQAGLLALGSFAGTAARVASSPFDPVAANDAAERRCTAVTGLIVLC